jgi:hypothetical protein
MRTVKSIISSLLYQDFFIYLTQHVHFPHPSLRETLSQSRTAKFSRRPHPNPSPRGRRARFYEASEALYLWERVG